MSHPSDTGSPTTTTMGEHDHQYTPPFLRLPGEIRNMIYNRLLVTFYPLLPYHSLSLSPTGSTSTTTSTSHHHHHNHHHRPETPTEPRPRPHRHPHPSKPTITNIISALALLDPHRSPAPTPKLPVTIHLAILRANRQIHAEAASIFYGSNLFVFGVEAPSRVAHDPWSRVLVATPGTGTSTTATEKDNDDDDGNGVKSTTTLKLSPRLPCPAYLALIRRCTIRLIACTLCDSTRHSDYRTCSLSFQTAFLERLCAGFVGGGDGGNLRRLVVEVTDHCPAKAFRQESLEQLLRPLRGLTGLRSVEFCGRRSAGLGWMVRGRVGWQGLPEGLRREIVGFMTGREGQGQVSEG